MARYITRVELHHANWPSDYDALHRFMGEENFHRTIQADDGPWYYLPTATYFSHGALSAHDVQALATRAAARTGRDADILVADAEIIAWTLKPVPQPNGLSAFAFGIPRNPLATSPAVLGALNRMR
jgi:Endoribonuclease GhoS